MRRARVVVVLVFVISRLAIARAGVTFDDRPLNDSFQLLELSSLRDDLLGSLVHLHSQPPLFNLVVGLAVQLPESWVRPLFHVAFLGIGLGLTLGIHTLLWRLGVSSLAAAAVALVFTLSPSVFLYENWLHYDYPVVLLLVLAALALQRFEEEHRARHAGIFLALLAVLTLTRSLFHIAWFLAWIAVVVLHRRREDWRRIVAVAAVPVLVVVGLHVQRLVMFGRFGVSTSLGMSFSKMTTFQLSVAERRSLVKEGELSELALIGPFSPLDAYGDALARHRPTGVEVLDDEFKTVSDGSLRSNYNNINYIEISDRYLEDARKPMILRPAAYLGAVRNAFDIFFRPSSDFFAVRDNGRHVAGLDRLSNAALGVPGGRLSSGEFPGIEKKFHPPGHTAWVVVVAYVVALGLGGALLWKRRADVHGHGPPLLVLAFLWSTIAWVTLVGNLLEIGENNRFRLYSDPLVLAMVAALVVGRRKVGSELVRQRGFSDELER